MWFGRREREVRALEEEAHSLLAAGRADDALALGERLLDLGWSGGFEIVALAHARRGDHERACAILEEALPEVPDAWSLLTLLGNLRSDLGRFEEAIAAFDRAEKVDGAGLTAVRFNRAVCRQRMGDPGLALADLDAILALPKPPAVAEDALGLAAQCLAEIGRADDGLGLIRAALEACADDDPRRDRLEAEHALALDRARTDPSEVRASLERALEAEIAIPALLALARRMDDSEPSGGVRYRLVIEGPVHDTPGISGFLRIFEVVAASPHEALRLASRCVRLEVRDALRVERCDVLEDPCDAAPGVWSASERLPFGE